MMRLVRKIVKLLILPIEEEQDKYMKDHILTPNHNDWKDDRSWRL